jgi:hypothetical protein
MLTWYDVPGVLPGAAPGEVRSAYQAQARLLAPQMLAGAQAAVLMTPHSAPARRVIVPGLRGRFVGRCLRVAGDLGLHLSLLPLVGFARRTRAALSRQLDHLAVQAVWPWPYAPRRAGTYSGHMPLEERAREAYFR